MKTLSQLIDSLTLEDSQTYQATTDRLMWIETDLLDPNGLSRRHALKVESKILELLQGEISQVKPANQYDAYLADARRELDAVRPVNYQLTPAEYKRRLYLINDEKNQLRAALGLAPITNQPTTGDLFQ